MCDFVQFFHAKIFSQCFLKFFFIILEIWSVSQLHGGTRCILCMHVMSVHASMCECQCNCADVWVVFQGYDENLKDGKNKPFIIFSQRFMRNLALKLSRAWKQKPVIAAMDLVLESKGQQLLHWNMMGNLDQSRTPKISGTLYFCVCADSHSHHLN